MPACSISLARDAFGFSGAADRIFPLLRKSFVVRRLRSLYVTRRYG
jgi:hypothetical protein